MGNKATRVLAFATVLFLVVFGAQVVSSQGEVRTVGGSVVNSTDRASDVSDLTVTLHRVGPNGFNDLTTITDETGAFSFQDVEYRPASAYGVSVRYQEAIYGTDIDLSAGTPDPITLTVFNATHDDTVVSTVSASLLIAAVDEAEQMLAALEIIRLSNQSNLAYVPGQGVMELLRFGLPPGASDLTLDTRLIGADFVQVDRGFALLASIPPGEHEVMFSYRFPYEGDSYGLEKSYRYGADTLRVLAAEEVLTIAANSVGEPQSVLIGERQYQLLETGSLTRGATISLTLEDLPLSSAGDRVGASFSQIRFEYAGPAALIALMVGLLVYGSIWRSGRQTRGAG